MIPFGKSGRFNSPIFWLITVNLITLLAFGLLFYVSISTFSRVRDQFTNNVHNKVETTVAGFSFGKELIALETEIHNYEVGFLHDPEGTVERRQKILAAFDGIIERIKLTPNYFQRKEELERLKHYRQTIEERIDDNVKISNTALKLELLNNSFWATLSEMEKAAASLIVSRVLEGLSPVGLQQVSALIPLCREQLLQAKILINRGADELDPARFSGVEGDDKPDLVGTLDTLVRTLETMTSADQEIAAGARKIISQAGAYREAAEEMAKLLAAKKRHHEELESQGRELSRTLEESDRKMGALVTQATDRMDITMSRAIKGMYLIGAFGFSVNLIVTFLIVMFGRRLLATLRENRRYQSELQGKMSELEMEVARRKEAEAAARRAADNLEETVAARTVELNAVNLELEAFISAMSHDLRTPLRGISGFSNAILEECATELSRPAVHYLERIQEAGIAMGNTIDQILELSRFSREKLQKEDLPLSSMVESVIMELQRNDPERSVQVEIGWDLRAFGAKNQVRALLERLLDNAWKFTRGRQDAKVEFGQTVKDGQAVFFVKDNGVGFNMAYSAKMFGAFQRLHNAREFPGSGVGLALAWRIVKHHGGKIWGESKEGEGAVFYFTLDGASVEDGSPNRGEA